MICNLSPGTEYQLHVQVVGNNNQSEKASPTVVETTPTGMPYNYNRLICLNITEI